MEKVRDNMKKGKANEFSIQDDEIIMYEKRLCVPNVPDLRRTILEEAHCSLYAMHPGNTKLYRDLNQCY